MRAVIQKHLQRFVRDERAPSAIEYALLVAGVGVLIIAIVYMLGGGTRSALQQADPTGPPSTSSSAP